MKIRLIGLALALGALALGYFVTYVPLHEAQQGAQGTISVSMKGHFLWPSLLLTGLWLLILSPADALDSGPMNPKNRKTRLTVVALVVVGGVAGFFVHQWLMDQLHVLGYLSGG